MARKPLSAEEAAQILNVLPEDVHRFREQRKLSGMKDGGTWKFKPDEVERLAEELKHDGASGSSGLSLELGEPDSVLLSEVELGKSPETTSSTIIGSKGKKTNASESDILMSGVTPPPRKKSESSDLKLSSSSNIGLAPSDSGKAFEEIDDFADLGSSGVSDLNLIDDAKPKAGQAKTPGSSVSLSDDDELVLGGSGSDVTLGGGDSGIGLSAPSDSGLNLEEPLELGGSNVEMMELGEDDVLSLEEDADLESATQLKADDEFLLTPSSGSEDSSDSGSQVIALDEGEFGHPSGGGMLVEDGGMMAGGMMGMAGAAAMTGMQPGGAMMFAPSIPEAPYSIWNILGLLVCIILLMLAGMFMYDLIRNMWSWDQTMTVNSSMMDAILKWFEK